MNLVTIIEKLRPLFNLDANEMRCLLLALTVHDLNKLERYQLRPNGKKANYANAASQEHLCEELKALEVDPFFPEWHKYRFDIIYLAHAHQEGTMVATVLNQHEIDQCRLDMGRLEGPLKFLMKVADVSDNSHSGDYTIADTRSIFVTSCSIMSIALYTTMVVHALSFCGASPGRATWA